MSDDLLVWSGWRLMDIRVCCEHHSSLVLRVTATRGLHATVASAFCRALGNAESD